MADPDPHHEQLREPCLLRGAGAEIGRHRGDDLAFVFLDQRSDALQAIAAHGKRRVALLLERGALGGKNQRQRVDICQNGTHSGVRATAICPSFVATDMTAHVTAVSRDEMIQPADLAELVATALALPNNAVVAELLVNCRLEDMF